MPLLPLAEGDRKGGRKNGGINRNTHGKVVEAVSLPSPSELVAFN